jgi:hypothetical protein
MNAFLIIHQILLELGRLDIEDVDEDTNMLEGDGTLGREIGFVKCDLATTVPEVEHE